MSRHRNVRTMNYEDDYYDEDDVYGHSVEDNYCVSPGTAAQFTFNRDRAMELSTFMGHEEGIPEEDEDEEETEEEDTPRDQHRGSLDYTRPQLSDIQEANLNSCLEEMHNILGESVPENIMVDTVIKHNFSLEASLNDLLSQQDAPKPQREPRGRRNRSQAQATDDVKPAIVTQTPSIDVPKVTGPTVILQKPRPKISVTESAESLSHVTVSDKTEIKSNDRTRDVTQSVTSKNSVDVSKNSKIDIKTQQKSQTASKNSQGNVDSKDAISRVLDSGAGRVSDSGASEGSVQKDQIPVPATVVTQSAVSNGSEKELSTPKKERYIPPLPRSASKSKNDKRDLIAEYKKRGGEKDMMNLVVIGHVDAGKSTLMGHLLYQLGNVNKRLMHKYEQESKKVGKSSFAYAWVLDETEEERVRGVTMDIAQTRFETPHKIITLLDAPGHKDFIPNMITGTAQADVAILVVNATKGEFETGFESGGQTREHALLARSLGVSQLIIAVNKMDTVGWEQSRYDEVVRKLGLFMKQAGYKDADTSYIPVSGLSGENLVKPISEPKLSQWYKGSTLVEQIDKFRSVSRPIDKPLRICVSDVFKGMGSGFSVTGKIASGCVQIGDRVLVMPAAEYAMVKGISINDEAVSYAFAGDHVAVIITGIDMAHVGIGSMLCDTQEPVLCATRIRARVVLFNLEIPMTRGFTVIFHFQSITEPAVVKKLVSHLNKTTGEVIKNKPKCLTKNSSAVVEIEFDRPVCLELYKDNKELGRFMLRSGGHTIAAGVTEEVLKTKTGAVSESQGASAY